MEKVLEHSTRDWSIEMDDGLNMISMPEMMCGWCASRSVICYIGVERLKSLGQMYRVTRYESIMTPGSKKPSLIFAPLCTGYLLFPSLKRYLDSSGSGKQLTFK